jgi:hypothetical protein
MNKSLAEMNKSGDGLRATKGYQPEGDLGERIEQAPLLPPPQAELEALAGQAPIPSGRGLIPPTVSRCPQMWELYIAAVALRMRLPSRAKMLRLLVQLISQPWDGFTCYGCRQG